MTQDPREFPVRPVEDWIIVDKIHVKTKDQKKAEGSNIHIVGGKAPQNVMDIEREAAMDVAKYENAEEELLKIWDDHPNQGTIKAIGPGRTIEEDVVVPVSVKVGEHVYLRGRTGEPLVVDGKLYWMHKMHEVFAVVRKK